MEYKCIECLIYKNVDDFRSSDRYKKGFVSRCKPCESKINKERRLRKNENINNNIMEYLAVKARNMRKYDRKMGYEIFTYPTVEELKKIIDKQKNICCYTGVKLEWKLDADIYHKGSFDRIDNKFGHEVDNMVVCSVYANYMRGPMDRNEFIKKLDNLCVDIIVSSP